jgi:hypothetical protein
VLALVAAVSLPHVSSATPDQEGPPKSARERRTEVRQKKGEVTVEVNALKARNAEVQSALQKLEANVAAQAAQLQEAERAAAAAAEDVIEAEAAVTAAEARLAAENRAADQFVAEAYMHPPSDNAFDAFAADSISDATVKQVLIDYQSDSDADVFDQLQGAHEDLEYERANKISVSAEAEQRKLTAADELAQLQAAQAQQASFAAEAEAALDRKLVEADNLASMDAELSRQISAEQAAMARQLAAARRAGGGGEGSAVVGSIGAVPGGTDTVMCPTGDLITVAGDIAGSVQGLLDDAGDAGLGLCGWGYRSGDRQIELRQAHCGTSDYAVWNMPSWMCSPPTARPGFSMHERGLAIDFTCSGAGIGSHGSPCFKFLASRAKRYGLYNLPSEPWHWSTTGD